MKAAEIVPGHVYRLQKGGLVLAHAERPVEEVPYSGTRTRKKFHGYRLRFDTSSEQLMFSPGGTLHHWELSQVWQSLGDPFTAEAIIRSERQAEQAEEARRRDLRAQALEAAGNFSSYGVKASIRLAGFGRYEVVLSVEGAERLLELLEKSE